jgi:hypothetical protein
MKVICAEEVFKRKPECSGQKEHSEIGRKSLHPIEIFQVL